MDTLTMKAKIRCDILSGFALFAAIKTTFTD